MVWVAEIVQGGAQYSGWKDSSGKIWFPTIKGLVIIDPKHKPIKSLPPVVIIEDVFIDEKIVKGCMKKQCEDLIVQPGKKKYEINYTGLSFSSPKRIRFKYRLKGFEQEWVDAGTRRSAIYPKLSPGKYIFELKACNENGVWNKKKASFRFEIKPYFYQTLWFYFSAVFVLIFIILFGYQLRVRHLKRKQRQLESLVKDRTSELSTVNKELVLANELKSEFLCIVAHDLQNPLSAIRRLSQGLSTHEFPFSTSSKHASLIYNASDQMLLLIHNLIESSRIDDGQVYLNIETLDLDKLIRKVLTKYRAAAKLKEQKLLFDINEECFIQGDKLRLEEILDNLISNAVKFTPFGKEIRVSANKSPESIQIRIEDEGPGFSEEDKKKIFLKFQHLSAEPTGGESSTGLGLSIAKRLVELHHGTIKLIEKDGPGSCFLIEFPIFSD